MHVFVVFYAFLSRYRFGHYLCMSCMQYSQMKMDSSAVRHFFWPRFSKIFLLLLVTWKSIGMFVHTLSGRRWCWCWWWSPERVSTCSWAEPESPDSPSSLMDLGTEPGANKRFFLDILSFLGHLDLLAASYSFSHICNITDNDSYKYLTIAAWFGPLLYIRMM